MKMSIQLSPITGIVSWNIWSIDRKFLLRGLLVSSITVFLFQYVKQSINPRKHQIILPLRKCCDCGPKSIMASCRCLERSSTDTCIERHLLSKSSRRLWLTELRVTSFGGNWLANMVMWSTSLWTGSSLCLNCWNENEEFWVVTCFKVKQLYKICHQLRALV